MFEICYGLKTVFLPIKHILRLKSSDTENCDYMCVKIAVSLFFYHLFVLQEIHMIGSYLYKIQYHFRIMILTSVYVLIKF